MAKILLVEDEVQAATMVQDWMQLQGHLVEMVTTAEDALQLLANFEYDIILLDWNLPGISGLEMCKRHRLQGGKTSILFLTGKGDIDDRIEGLNTGADDYLVKPFDVRELAARVRGLLRRPVEGESKVLTAKGLVLNTANRSVTSGDKFEILRAKECEVLELLLVNRGSYFTSKQLIAALWRIEAHSSTNTVRQVINTLRQKLTSLGHEHLIVTAVGSGYTIPTDH